MSIGINTNYGNYNYAGVNNVEPSWAKNDEKDEKKESTVNQQGAVYEKTAVKENSRHAYVKSRNASIAGVDFVIECKAKNASAMLQKIQQMEGIKGVSLLDHDGEIHF